MHDWDEIRKDHGPMLWRTIGRILRNPDDIHDCYQDVLLEAFSRSRERVITNMPGLLRWLAVRRALDLLRKLKARPDQVPNQAIHELACGRSQEEQRIKELLECVRAELTAVPAQQAESFWLCCVEGLKYREAAEVMGLETQHVGVLVLRARKHLSIVLAQWDRERAV